MFWALSYWDFSCGYYDSKSIPVSLNALVEDASFDGDTRGVRDVPGMKDECLK
jgi:hypothetical protein